MSSPLGTSAHGRKTNESSGCCKDDLDRGVTVLYGGAPPLDHVVIWDWDGKAWTGKMPVSGPTDNLYHTVGAMTYDTFRRVTFFGPTSDGFLPWLKFAATELDFVLGAAFAS